MLKNLSIEKLEYLAIAGDPASETLVLGFRTLDAHFLRGVHP